MKLAISNIAWSEDQDEIICKKLHEIGVHGLEIAPTRIIKEEPYDKIKEIEKYSSKLKEEYSLIIPSIQSIWYGRQENIFDSEDDRKTLVEYTKKAIDFASAIGCGNLVFGCPRNRNMPEKGDINIAIDFFKELGEYAVHKGTCIGMEANPTIYNTNFINTTQQAIDLIKEINSDGFKLNLDMGTMIYNHEDLSVLEGNEHFINHVHISEPGLKVLESRKMHGDLLKFLRSINYTRYVSIEMGKVSEIETIFKCIDMVKAVC